MSYYFVEENIRKFGFHFYSAIHKATGRPHGSQSFHCFNWYFSNGTGTSHEWGNSLWRVVLLPAFLGTAGNYGAGGFGNSAVRARSH